MTGLGHFGNSRKTVTWPPENSDSVVVRFLLKTAVFGFGFKTVTALNSIDNVVKLSIFVDN